MLDLHFHNPQFLWLLVLAPLAAWWGVAQGRSRAALRFSTASIFWQQPSTWRVLVLRLLPWVHALVVVCSVVALARPQSRGARQKNLSVEGIDIVVALDLSTSMEAGDFRPLNRLHVAKQVLNDFISSRVNDRVGLVVFAGEAYTQVPLTFDYSVLKEVVQQLSTRVIEDGTAIGDALAVSLNRLRHSEAKSKVVILITDGDNNAGKISPMDAAAMAKALKVPVFTILVGKGGRVPFPTQNRDLFGNPVWRDVEIPINPELLEKISSLTGGESYRAVDRESLSKGLQKVLDALDRSKLVEGGAVANDEEEYPPFLWTAFGLAAMELAAAATVLRVFP